MKFEDFSYEENKELLIVMNWAKVFMDFRKAQSLKVEKDFITNILQKYPQNPSTHLVKLRPALELSLESICKEEAYFESYKPNQYSTLFKEKKGAVVNWLIYELAKFLRNSNKDINWSKIVFVLLSHETSVMLLSAFNVKHEIVYDENVAINMAKIRSRRNEWISLCKKNKISPDIFTNYTITN